MGERRRRGRRCGDRSELETRIHVALRSSQTTILDAYLRSASYIYDGGITSRGDPMIRQIGLAAAAIIPQLERLLSHGGAVPLAVATAVAYILLIGRRRGAPV
jgi:hypothetical protein